MKTTMTHTEFIDAFESSDTYRNNFSRKGLLALFVYLEDLEFSTGEEMEFDMVGIACDFTEYASIAEFRMHYGSEYERVGIACDTWHDVCEDTTVIPVGDGAIVQDF